MVDQAGSPTHGTTCSEPVRCRFGSPGRDSEPKSLVGENVVPHHLTTKRSHKTVVLCLSNAAVPGWSAGQKINQNGVRNSLVPLTYVKCPNIADLGTLLDDRPLNQSNSTAGKTKGKILKIKNPDFWQLETQKYLQFLEVWRYF